MAPYALPDISAAPGVEAIVLAQNEHAYAPSATVRAAVAEALERAQLYPDSEWRELRAAIAGVHDLQADNIVCGAGSMELMGGLMQAYMGPGNEQLMTQYGYLFMRTLAQLVGAEVTSAPEPERRVDVDAILELLRADTRMVFVVNPGNPCGSVIHNDEIRRLHAALSEDVMLLVDEAYAEFVAPDFHSPLFDLIEAGNVVITRTFSKIYGLAGMRVGWAYLPDEIRDQLRKVINPSSVSLVSQVAATAAMRDRAAADSAQRLIAEQRDFLSGAISDLGFDVVPSQTNFILVDFASDAAAADAFDFLRRRGLIMRPMGGYALPSCLRITVGTPQQMQATAAALAEWKRGHG